MPSRADEKVIHQTIDKYKVKTPVMKMAGVFCVFYFFLVGGL